MSNVRLPSKQEYLGSLAIFQARRQVTFGRSRRVPKERRHGKQSPKARELNGTVSLWVLTETDTAPAVHYIAPSLARSICAGQATSIEDMANAVSTVRINLLGRGTPDPCARVYRLPAVHGSAKVSLRDQWLALDPAREESNAQKKKRQRSLPSSVLKSTSPAVIQRQLAADLLKPPQSDNNDSCPPLPGREDLIGFVTKGEFSLTQGKGVAIGSVLVQRLIATANANEKEPYMCIVRNAGETVGRLGRLEFV